MTVKIRLHYQSGFPKSSLSAKRRTRHLDTAKSMGSGNAARGVFGTTTLGTFATRQGAPNEK